MLLSVARGGRLSPAPSTYYIGSAFQLQKRKLLKHGLPMFEVVIKMQESLISKALDLEERSKTGYGWLQQYLPELKQKYPGQLVAIHEHSGEYFFGNGEISALDVAEKKYPDTVFYVAVIPKDPELLRAPTPRYFQPPESGTYCDS
jgi:hypothetical protein